VKVAGIDHVGLGSDFDGANMPYGMEDATMLPKITEGLFAKRIFRRYDVKRIPGQNTLRVMTDVERVGREWNSQR
jgi:membrane dipeptidase